MSASDIYPTGEQAPTGCCPPAEQQSCCAPAEKDACCGTAPSLDPSGCGCR